MTRKRILFLYLGFLSLLLCGTWLVLRETGVARTFVENVLTQFLERDAFSLRDANVDLGDGTVTLRGLEIATPDDGGGSARMAVDRVEVGVDTNPLGEVGRVRSVRLRGMRLELDLAQGRFPDLQQLLTNRTPGGEEPPPPVEITESVLSLRLLRDGPPMVFENVELQLLPTQPESFEVALRGSMTAPSGHRVVVEGHGDLRSPEFRAMLRMTDVPLAVDVARRYSPAAADFLEEIDAKGTARSITIWTEYPDSRAATGSSRFVAGVRAELTDLCCSVPQLPYPIVGASARASADLRDGGTLTFVLEDESIDGDLRIEGTVARLLDATRTIDVHVDARDVLVGPVLARALEPIDAVRPVWEAFEPHGGRLDASVRMAMAQDRERPRIAVDITLDGVGAKFIGFARPDGTRHHGFPFPMEDLRGSIHVADGEVTITDVRTRLGSHEVALDGHVHPNKGEPPRIELDVRSPEIAFTDEIRAALESFDPEIAEIYDRYTPRGATALEIEVRSGPELPNTGVRVRLRPLGASAEWEGFPYRVEQITGTVDIGTDGVFLELEGTRGLATSVALTGRFPSDELGETNGPQALLRVAATDLRMDDDLRRAMRELSAELGRTIDFLGVEGSCDVDLTTWRDTGAVDFGYDVRVDLEEGSVHLENLPLPTRDLEGPVFVHGEGARSRIEVSAVRGIIENGAGREPADLVVHGVVHAGDDDYTTDLSAVVRNLELNDRLGRAVDQFGAFDLDTWNVLQPSGSVDLIWRQTKEASEPEPHQTLRLQLLDVASAAPFLPAPAEDMYGDVKVVDGFATFADVRATMADAKVHCARGSAWSENGESVFQALVSSDDFPVDDRLANLLDGPLKRAYLDREVRGRVRIHELEMELRFPADVAQRRSLLSGRISALGLRMNLGTEISELTGLWNIDRVMVDADGGIVEGSVEGGAVSVHAHRVTDVQARFSADAESVRFAGIQGRLHGGAIRGSGEEHDLVYQLGEPGQLAFDLAWEDLSLSQMMRAAGVREERYTGRLSGHLRLERLVGVDIVNAVGAGELRITEGDLGQVPVFTTIYSYLAEPRRPKFEELRMAFTIQDQRVNVHDLEVSSPLITATGHGTIDMGGYVDMRVDFPDFFGKDADWLFLPQMLRMLTSELAQFQIYGNLRAPQTRPLWLWREAAPRLPLGPIPAAR